MSNAARRDAPPGNYVTHHVSRGLATLTSGERLGDLSSEWINAGGVRHVGGGGNREAEIGERQERDGTAHRTAAMTDHPCGHAGELDAGDRPAERVGRWRSRGEPPGRLEGGDRVRLQEA